MFTIALVECSCEARSKYLEARPLPYKEWGHGNGLRGRSSVSATDFGADDPFA